MGHNYVNNYTFGTITPLLLIEIFSSEIIVILDSQSLSLGLYLIIVTTLWVGHLHDAMTLVFLDLELSQAD